MGDEYINANEARQISDDICNNKLKEELDWVYALINKACFEGKHSVKFSNKTLALSTIKFLKSKGFTTAHFSGSQWDPADDTTISW